MGGGCIVILIRRCTKGSIGGGGTYLHLEGVPGDENEDPAPVLCLIHCSCDRVVTGLLDLVVCQ